MPEILPHSFHIKQANCQAAVWQQCHLQHPQPLHLRPWDGSLKTVSLYQFLSLFLQVLMHVLTSSSVLAQSNVQKVVANAQCLVYHAQQDANAITLAIFVTTVKDAIY